MGLKQSHKKHEKSSLFFECLDGLRIHFSTRISILILRIYVALISSKNFPHPISVPEQVPEQVQDLGGEPEDADE